MERSQAKAKIRCAIYTRKSTEEGLEQEFNSLDAQRESSEAFIKSQAHEADKSYGVVVNPDKSNKVTFTVDDKIIVLAES